MAWHQFSVTYAAILFPHAFIWRCEIHFLVVGFLEFLFWSNSLNTILSIRVIGSDESCKWVVWDDYWKQIIFFCFIFSLLTFACLLCSWPLTIIFSNDIIPVSFLHSFGGGVYKVSDCCSNSWYIFLCMVCFKKALASKQYIGACILHSGLPPPFFIQNCIMCLWNL